MLDDEILNNIFENNYEKIEKKISKEYHNKIKNIETEDKEERANIKMSIICELYYKEGFKEGVNFVINSMRK